MAFIAALPHDAELEDYEAEAQRAHRGGFQPQQQKRCDCHLRRNHAAACVLQLPAALRLALRVAFLSLRSPSDCDWL